MMRDVLDQLADLNPIGVDDIDRWMGSAPARPSMVDGLEPAIHDELPSPASWLRRTRRYRAYAGLTAAAAMATFVVMALVLRQDASVIVATQVDAPVTPSPSPALAQPRDMATAMATLRTFGREVLRTDGSVVVVTEAPTILRLMTNTKAVLEAHLSWTSGRWSITQIGPPTVGGDTGGARRTASHALVADGPNVIVDVTAPPAGARQAVIFLATEAENLRYTAEVDPKPGEPLRIQIPRRPLTTGLNALVVFYDKGSTLVGAIGSPSRALPTMGPIPSEAKGPSGQFDLSVLPDYISVLDRAGNPAGFVGPTGSPPSPP